MVEQRTDAGRTQQQAVMWAARVLAVWGVADSIWLALRPTAWARFWGGWLRAARRGGVFPRALAVFELAASLVLLKAVGWRR